MNDSAGTVAAEILALVRLLHHQTSSTQARMKTMAIGTAIAMDFLLPEVPEELLLDESPSPGG
jgi:hypothetical protein